MEKTICAAEGCTRTVRCKKLCAPHYDKWLRETPREQRPTPTLRQRLLAQVAVDASGCWLWQGYIGPTGYGQVRGRGRKQPAHRAAYEEWIGPIPEGLEPDHRCRVRHCVNPQHLELVTHRENLLRSEGFAGVNARKTHCPKGHPYAGANLIVRRNRHGNAGRQCRICRDECNRRRYVA